jgi:hypothetical protein
MSKDFGDSEGEVDFNIIQRLVRVERRLYALEEKTSIQLANRIDQLEGRATDLEEQLQRSPSESWRKLENLTELQLRYVIDFLEGEQADLQDDIDDARRSERANPEGLRADLASQIVSDALEIILQALRGE